MWLNLYVDYVQVNEYNLNKTFNLKIGGSQKQAAAYEEEYDEPAPPATGKSAPKAPIRKFPVNGGGGGGAVNVDALPVGGGGGGAIRNIKF